MTCEAGVVSDAGATSLFAFFSCCSEYSLSHDCGPATYQLVRRMLSLTGVCLLRCPVYWQHREQRAVNQLKGKLSREKAEVQGLRAMLVEAQQRAEAQQLEVQQLQQLRADQVRCSSNHITQQLIGAVFVLTTTGNLICFATASCCVCGCSFERCLKSKAIFDLQLCVAQRERLHQASLDTVTEVVGRHYSGSGSSSASVVDFLSHMLGVESARLYPVTATAPVGKTWTPVRANSFSTGFFPQT